MNLSYFSLLLNPGNASAKEAAKNTEIYTVYTETTKGLVDVILIFRIDRL